MHFLKCNNCGHFNEVKTEYLIFCSKCNKKLDNNYPDWSKRNPDKSLDDYKQLICTTQINEIPDNKIKFNKSKNLIIGISIAVIVVIFFLIGQLGGKKIVELIKKPFYNKVLMESASELNKSCPIMIDNATRLDNAVALSDNVFQYNFTLVNMVKDSVNIDDLKKRIEPNILNNAKTNPEMKTIRDNKTTLNYYYKDKSGVYLFTISIKPEQYK
jgi:hypothetical protein